MHVEKAKYKVWARLNIENIFTSFVEIQAPLK